MVVTALKDTSLVIYEILIIYVFTLVVNETVTVMKIDSNSGFSALYLPSYACGMFTVSFHFFNNISLH